MDSLIAQSVKHLSAMQETCPRPGGASLGDRPWREGLLGPKPLFGTDFGALILPVFRGRPPRLQGILEHSTFPLPLHVPHCCLKALQTEKYRLWGKIRILGTRQGSLMRLRSS